MKKSRGAGVEKSAEASSKHDDEFFGFATCVICQEVIHRATCIRLALRYVCVRSTRITSQPQTAKCKVLIKLEGFGSCEPGN